MKKFTCFLFTSSLVLSLTACGVSFHEDTRMGTKWSIKDEKLADGSTVKVGMLKPTDSWGCTELANNYYNWGLLEFQGKPTAKEIFGGKDQIVADKAVDYANQNNLKPNYIYYFVPTQYSVNDINLNAVSGDSKVLVTYYQCKVIAP